MSDAKSMSRHLWFRMDEETREALERIAAQDRESYAVVLRRLIREEAERRGVKP